MPIGSFAILPDVVNELVKKQPASVLDLGIGFGMYGAAVREWLDMGVRPYKVYLEGVETFKDYNSPLWKLYDWVFEGDIITYLLSTGLTYDAIIFTDVIEHFNKVEGKNVLEDIKARLNPGGILLVGTPAIFCPQGAVHGNEKETHHSLWTCRDFIDSGFIILRNGEVDKYGHQMILAKYQKV